ncbi:MAG: Ger(x)C family spore germination protein [Carboxydocellales bacterium]
MVAIVKTLTLLTLNTLILMLLFSGCWSQKEVNHLALVSAIGVDRSGSGNHITVQIIKPSKRSGQSGGREGNNQKFLVVESNGKTIKQALDNMYLSRQIFLGHNSIIILGKEMARAGIGDVLEWASRTSQIRRTTYLAVADGEARDILEARMNLADIPSLGMRDLLQQKTSASKTLPVQLKDFLKVYLSETSQATVPLFTLEKIPENTEVWGVRQNGETLENGESSENGKPKYIKSVKYSGTAVFRRDKLVSLFTPEETRGILWLKEKIAHSSININSLAGKKGNASFAILESSSRTKAIYEGGKHAIKVEIDAAFVLAENLFNINLSPVVITRLEEELNKAVANDIRHTVCRAQQLNCDIFGFGEVIHRNFPEQWPQIKKNWDVLFPKLSVRIQVRSHIRRRGITTEHP